MPTTASYDAKYSVPGIDDGGQRLRTLLAEERTYTQNGNNEMAEKVRAEIEALKEYIAARKRKLGSKAAAKVAPVPRALPLEAALRWPGPPPPSTFW